MKLDSKVALITGISRTEVKPMISTLPVIPISQSWTSHTGIDCIKESLDSLKKDIPALAHTFILRGRHSTTGAGQGIGRAYAHALGEAGAAVAVVDIQEEKAKQVCQELSRKGVRCIPIKADITNPKACEG